MNDRLVFKNRLVLDFGLKLLKRQRAWSYLIIFLIFSACEFQTANSVSGDRDTYTPSDPVDTSDLSAVRFAAAKAVLKSKCASCHGSFVSYTEAQWITLQYIVPGSSSTSSLVLKLANAIPGSGGNMPLGEVLPTESISTIRAWIDGISTSDTTTGSSDTGSGSSNPTAAQRTAAALSVISISCKTCHTVTRTGASSAYVGTTVPAFANSTNFATDSDFIVAGLISPGNAANSWIYRALKTYGNIGTMPKNASALTSSQQKSLADWINGIGQP